MPTLAVANKAPLQQLASICQTEGTFDLAERLRRLDAWLRDDVAQVARALQDLRGGERVVETAAVDLVTTRGKYLRPICVALASRTGRGFTPAAHQLAVAVEMVHNATLLHDDVVDLAETRRGKPAARVLYGNAASIFAGDWLLVNALMRVQASGVDGALPLMLSIIEEMVLAESLQLERRGKIDDEALSTNSYLAVARGKTAALFRWAMIAGARAGGVSAETEKALEAFGLHLGVAFQVIDDCLDFAGNESALGKKPLADLREGKVTYPLIVAARQVPAIVDNLREFLATPETDAAADSMMQHIAALVRSSGALDAANQFATAQIEAAIAQLVHVDECEAKEQLRTVAYASLARSH
jgi:octaprenyl-diphosphate synthase